MFSKIMISGEIEVLTGMHIGTGGEFAAIGAVDSPVSRDKISQLPVIPGSTLKGKLRSVLARQYNSHTANSAADDCEEIKRLFGCADKNKARNSRVIFSDMVLSNSDELKAMNVDSATEVKFENTISRLSGVANPRQIERVIRGSKFKLELIYNAEKEDEAEDDIKMLCEGMKLLEYDYIGGHGSRGYGRIRFNDLSAEAVIGEPDDELMESINNALKEV